jgi:hypothetical protein
LALMASVCCPQYYQWHGAWQIPPHA